MDKINTPGTTGHTFDNVHKRLKRVLDDITPDDWKAKIRKVEDEENSYAIYDKIDPPPPAITDEVNEIDFDHVDQQQQQQSQPDEPNVIVVTPIEPLKCTLCKFESIDSVKMRQHMKATYECEHCNKTFHGRNASHYYNSHQKSHLPKPPKPEKPTFACDICGKDFKQKSLMTRHKLRGPCGRQ